MTYVGEERSFLKRVYVLPALLIILVLAIPFAEPAWFVLGIVLDPNGDAIKLPQRPAPSDQTEARRQDVADLQLLPNYDRSFSPVSKAAFLQGAKRLDAMAPSMSRAGFEMAVSRLVALAGNAHTTVGKKQRAAGFGRIPLRFAWFADGLYVVRAGASAEEMLGRRVLSIDGRPVEQALADLQPYLSGTAERARDDSPPLLDCPSLLQVIWPETDGVHLTVGLDGGSIDQFAALPPAPDPFARQPVMVIGPGGMRDGWRAVLAQAPAIPPSLREPERVAYSEPLAPDGLYIRINANADDAHGPLADQLGAIAARKPSDGWRRIVLDLRFDDGGDERKTMRFTHALPDLLTADGGVWILTGNATFSAAIIIVARVKHFLGSRAHIVGQPVGDHNPFWTDGGPPLVLRNSGIVINHAYFKQDWVHGCYAMTICNPLQFLYGVAAGDLSPEVAVGWSFADYAAGRDTVFERAMMLSR